MNRVFVFILFIFPFSGSHYLVPRCHSEVEVTQVTRYGTICHARLEKMCKTEYKTEYETGYTQQCEETHRETCETAYKTEYREVCQTVYEEACQQTDDTTYRTECHTTYQNVCHRYKDSQKCQKMPQKNCHQVENKIPKQSI